MSLLFFIAGDSMDTGIKDTVINEMRVLAKAYDIEKVILFGSRTRGDYRRTSDIDLAVSGGDVAQFALAVNEETSTLLMYDVVDLALPIQSALRESIYREGIVIYEKVWKSYNENIALTIVRQTKESFYTMFVALKEEVEKNWL